MRIEQMEREAQDRMVGGLPMGFKLILPPTAHEVKARWLDPYFGLYTIDGHDGFFMTRELVRMPGLECEWLEPEATP